MAQISSLVAYSYAGDQEKPSHLRKSRRSSHNLSYRSIPRSGPSEKAKDRVMIHKNLAVMIHPNICLDYCWYTRTNSHKDANKCRSVLDFY